MNDYRYNVNSRQVTIRKYEGTDEITEIPSRINGYPVTNIAESAFEGCATLVIVKIPDTVTRIDDLAFSFCPNLQNLIIGANVNFIGAAVFRDCVKLTEIIIPISVTSIGEIAFFRCTSLYEITIPDNVKSLGGGAFRECTNLISAVIGNDVESISDHTFLSCTNLANIVIGKNVISIGIEAFKECQNLSDIKIPDNVKSIGKGAFEGCPKETRRIVNYNKTKSDSPAKSFLASLTEDFGEPFVSMSPPPRCGPVPSGAEKLQWGALGLFVNTVIACGLFLGLLIAIIPLLIMACAKSLTSSNRR